ncbi:MAG TPA: 30S ribosomal protein S6 [Clostridia bacterium]|nr:30S ribosomal protein S6 [Clostridia bacterium]
MRKYEVMFIVRPDIADEDVDKLVSTLETNVTNAGGHITSVERMGKRRLAYPVRKFQDGNYILFHVEGPGSVIKETERRLRVAEQVIKFITVRTDEEEQRLAKVKKIRDSRQRGRGTQAQAAAQQAAEAAGAEGAPAAV